MLEETFIHFTYWYRILLRSKNGMTELEMILTFATKQKSIEHTYCAIVSEFFYSFNLNQLFFKHIVETSCSIKTIKFNSARQILSNVINK